MAIGGVVAWTVPSALDVYGTNKKEKYTYYDLDGKKLPFSYTHDFEVTVTNQETIKNEIPLACTTKWGNCKIRYDENYTP